MMNPKNDTMWAVCFILFGIMVLVTGPYIMLNEGRSLLGYWLGIGITTVLLLLFFVSSYYKGKRKLTAKEKRNAQKTVASMKYFWLWAGIGYVFYIFSEDVLDKAGPVIFGGFGTVMILMGTAMLLDKFWLKAIFIWNNTDPKVRKLWG